MAVIFKKSNFCSEFMVHSLCSVNILIDILGYSDEMCLKTTGFEPCYALFFFFFTEVEKYDLIF